MTFTRPFAICWKSTSPSSWPVWEASRTRRSARLYPRRERNPELILRFPEQSIESSRACVMNLTLDTWEVMDPNRSCMPAGQGVGGIDEILPAGEIVRRILAEARATIRRLEKLL